MDGYGCSCVVVFWKIIREWKCRLMNVNGYVSSALLYVDYHGYLSCALLYVDYHINEKVGRMHECTLHTDAHSFINLPDTLFSMKHKNTPVHSHTGLWTDRPNLFHT